MKLVRYGDFGAERPGLIDAEGTLRDLSGLVHDIAGDTLSPETLERIANADHSALPAVDGNPRMGCPVALGGINKFMCIGLNFTDHAEETGNPIPEHPVLFMKANSAVVGPNDDVMMPRGSTKVDWEVELGVVIGTKAKYVSEADALDHVAGYCVINDVSEREFQNERSGQWTKGKSPDTFGPTGPWLVTKDEVGDVQELDMWLDVNGERRQTGNTRTMIFSVARIVSDMSQMFTLHPGDIISTGTPPGVGMGMKPQVWLREGDTMTVYIEKLGTQVQKVGRDA